MLGLVPKVHPHNRNGGKRQQGLMERGNGIEGEEQPGSMACVKIVRSLQRPACVRQETEIRGREDGAWVRYDGGR